MEPRAFLEFLHTAEQLKDTVRHCVTSKGRWESVAEHSWRVSLMAYALQSEFPEADMNKVMRMCLIHDLGECFTGDIPVFQKTAEDRVREAELLAAWVETLPEGLKEETKQLYEEMEAMQTLEARIHKSLDKLEALIQHNEAPLSSWEDHEYDLQRTYGWETVECHPWLKALREEVLQDTETKIKEEK